MKAKQGYRHLKSKSPHIGRWLKRYWQRRTCRRVVFAPCLLACLLLTSPGCSTTTTHPDGTVVETRIDYGKVADYLKSYRQRINAIAERRPEYADAIERIDVRIGRAIYAAELADEGSTVQNVNDLLDVASAVAQQIPGDDGLWAELSIEAVRTALVGMGVQL